MINSFLSLVCDEGDILSSLFTCLICFFYSNDICCSFYFGFVFKTGSSI